jgi:hypothetical protein
MVEIDHGLQEAEPSLIGSSIPKMNPRKMYGHCIVVGLSPNGIVLFVASTWAELRM